MTMVNPSQLLESVHIAVVFLLIMTMPVIKAMAATMAIAMYIERIFFCPFVCLFLADSSLACFNDTIGKYFYDVRSVFLNYLFLDVFFPAALRAFSLRAALSFFTVNSIISPPVLVLSVSNATA